MRRGGAALLLAGLAAAPGMARAQERPLERAFVAGDARRYRVELVVRTELEGQQPVRIGVKGYAEPFARFAEARLVWRVARRIVSVEPGGAQIEETLEDFRRAGMRVSGEADPEWRKVSTALEEGLRKWAEPRALRYRETPAGSASSVPAEGAPALGEGVPLLVTLWLLRALRPAVALPARPIRFGERWQEPRAVELPGWNETQGQESGEWLAVPDFAEPAARLHVVQQISGNTDAASQPLAGGANAPVVESVAGRFHGESLATISLTDGRLIAATRSASRETVWTLARPAGFEQPPRFRGRLSVQVRIEECVDDCR
jgi:hypothetical protein